MDTQVAKQQQVEPAQPANSAPLLTPQDFYRQMVERPDVRAILEKLAKA